MQKEIQLKHSSSRSRVNFSAYQDFIVSRRTSIPQLSACTVSAQTGLTVLHLAAVQGNLQTVQQPGRRAARWQCDCPPGYGAANDLETTSHQMLNMLTYS
jgi:hypothetical protein